MKSTVFIPLLSMNCIQVPFISFSFIYKKSPIRAASKINIQELKKD